MKMEGKEKGYEHTNAWWKPNKARLSRAPPRGAELRAFMREGPEKWGMNLLVKVLKYSSFELLERYQKEWMALNVLIDTRKDVTVRDATKRIPPGDSDRYFQAVINALGELDLIDAMEEAENLKSSMCFHQQCYLFCASVDFTALYFFFSLYFPLVHRETN